MKPRFHYTLDMQEWALLVYRLPRDPSTPRIALWRRLRRLGASQLLDGLAALPLTSETQEQLEWLAEEVEQAGGSATVWLARPSTAAESRELEARMRDAADEDYARVAAAARGKTDGRTIGRLRRAVRAISARDYFGAPGREEAERAVAELAQDEVPA
jgi:ChrB-like protein